MKWLSSSEQEAKEAERLKRQTERIRRELAALTIQVWWRKVQQKRLRAYARHLRYVDPYDHELRSTKQKYLVSHLYTLEMPNKLPKKGNSRMVTARSNASFSSNESLNSLGKRNSFLPKVGRRNQPTSARSNNSNLTSLSYQSTTSALGISYRSAIKAYLNPKFLGDARSVTSVGSSSPDNSPNEVDDGKSGRSRLTGFSKAASGVSASVGVGVGAKTNASAQNKAPSIVVSTAGTKNRENAANRNAPTADNSRLAVPNVKNAGQLTRRTEAAQNAPNGNSNLQKGTSKTAAKQPNGNNAPLRSLNGTRQAVK